MKNAEKICILMGLIILAMACLWCIDVSVSGMINDGVMSNGFLDVSPVITYHIALIGLIIILLIVSFLAVINILKE